MVENNCNNTAPFQVDGSATGQVLATGISAKVLCCVIGRPPSLFFLLQMYVVAVLDQPEVDQESDSNNNSHYSSNAHRDADFDKQHYDDVHGVNTGDEEVEGNKVEPGEHEVLTTLENTNEHDDGEYRGDDVANVEHSLKPSGIFQSFEFVLPLLLIFVHERGQSIEHAENCNNNGPSSQSTATATAVEGFG